jgi:hypothetical protein
MKKLLFLSVMALGLTILSQGVEAQLRVRNLNDGVTPQQMVNQLLGGGVTAFNVRYTGANNAAGVFCNGSGVFGFVNGIVLTSGSTTNVIGPNNDPRAGTDNVLPGDLMLGALIPGFQTFDACVLEFDFIPAGNQVQFNYVFGSEEYNEFVNSSFNDVFGFFVNGVNYALIPHTLTPVAINNVNNGNSAGVSAGPCMNCEFFIDNVDSHLNTQLDGLTVVLPMIAPVKPGVVNHMKIAIADAGDGIFDSAVFVQAGSLKSGTPKCITRTARFWFTHVGTNDTSCVTLNAALQNALTVGCDAVDLGFMSLPTLPRYGNVTERAELAVIEALGVYYRSNARTGEPGGTQGSGLSASALCRARKQLAIELIAATANNALLGTDPSICTYFNGVTTTNFPTDLLDQARAAATGVDVVQVTTMRVLLQKFNKSGLTSDFPLELAECSPGKTSALRKLSRDPTTQLSCPGVNNSCDTAEAIVFLNATDLFASAKFSRTVSLLNFPSFLFTNGAATCAPAAGAFPGPVWKITPNVGGAGRQFTVATYGSNFDTLLQVFSGACSNLVAVICNDDAPPFLQSRVSFMTDGSNTFYIVPESVGGAVGKLKLHVTSP